MRFDTSALEELEERFRNFQKRIPEECEKEALLRDEYASSITKEDVKRAFMIKLLLPVKKSRWKQISLIVGSSFLGAFVKYAADRNIISEDIELLDLIRNTGCRLCIFPSWENYATPT